MRGVWLRLRRLLGWRDAERDIEAELRFHVDMETEALIRGGMDPREARRRATLAFGGEARYREETRAVRGTAWVEDATRDVRFALRTLSRSPAFTLSALATLVLGVGATTAIFSVVRGVVLAPLPYPDSDGLVTVWMSNPAQGIDEDITSWPNFTDWRSESETLRPMVAVRGQRWALTGDGEPEEVRGAAVSRGFFEMLGAPLSLGRAFEDGEVEGDDVRVAVLSDELWRRRFGADPTLVGRTIRLNDEAWEVIGVAAAGQRYPRDAEVWVPLTFGPGLTGLRDARGALWLPVVGRLTDGSDLTAAQAEMDGIAARLRDAYPQVNEGVGIALEPLRETVVGDVTTPLMILLGSVALVLLIAVVNVANLLLARGSARTRELALRLTLGAGRGRVVRQVLAEGLVLGTAGAVGGAALAASLVDAVHRLAPPGLPRIEEVGVDAALLTVALAVSLASSLVFSTVPALQAARVDPGAGLEDGARGMSSGRLARLRGLFVTGQFALALVLLVGAGLLGRSFVKLTAVDPGFRPEGVLSARLTLPASRYPSGSDVLRFGQELRAGIGALPGVEHSGTITTMLLSALPDMGAISLESRPDLGDLAMRYPVVSDAASVGLVRSAGMELVAGRDFTDADGPDDPLVALVNQSFVDVFLPRKDPIGERFMWGEPRGDDPGWLTIVGVVADARRSGLATEVRPAGIMPLAQFPDRRMELLVRASGDPVALTPAVREVVRSIDPQLPLTRVRTLEQAMSESLSARRLVMLMLATFALSALVLATVGIYGVMAYVVGQRTREIGIRVALGEARSGILRRVLRQGMVHAAFGLAIGSVGAVLLAGVVRTQLFGLEPTDPVTFAGAAVVLLLTSALACVLPARRAAALDPMVALRRD